MTVSAAINRVDYTGNGVLDTYPYTFMIFADADLEVYVDGALQVLNVNYTVTDAGVTTGGNVVFAAGSIPGVSIPIAIIRVLDMTQETDYVELDKFSAETHEAALDKLTMICQQISESYGRAPKFPVSSSFKDIPFPDLEAGYFLQVNPAGTGLLWSAGTPVESDSTFLDGTEFQGLWYDSSTYASINAAVTAIGGTEATLVVSSSETLTGSITFPSTLTLKIQKGGSIIKASSYTVTINGHFEAGRYQVFSGFSSGNITFGPNSVDRVYPEWWATNTTPGSTDMGAAILAAGNTLLPVDLAPTSYKVSQQLDVTGWIMTGKGWQSSAGTRTLLAFSGLGTDAAMITRTATNGRRAILENFFMYGNSWASGTGCEGYGMDIEQLVTVRNVYVYGFKLSGIFTHNNAAGDGGPYDSLFENVQSHYNGAHGFLAGTGSNAMTFINCSGKWNGAPSYGVAPSVAGSGDGFHLEYANEGNPSTAYNSYVTEAIKILGGDCSYNSRYGWNFVDGASCDISPSYAEGNLQAAPGQVSIGDVSYCFFRLGAVSGAAAGVNFAADYADYLNTNTVFVAGKSYGSGNSNTAVNRRNYINANLNTIFAYADESNYVSLAPVAGDHLAINQQGTSKIKILNLDTYADNAAALAGGLTAGMLYVTPAGVLMIVYTP